MNLGIVGFSNYVQRAYVPYINKQTSIRVAAMFDPRPDHDINQSISESGLNSHPRLFDHWQQFLGSENMEAVLISSPHVFHFQQVMDCLESGRHVLVDKPLACRYEEGRQLVDLAKNRGLVLAVGNQRRYEAPYQKLKEEIAGGNVGDIKLIHYMFSNSPWYDYRKTWRGDPGTNCGGAMIDIGHLAADMLCWLTEMPIKWVEAELIGSNDQSAEHTVIALAELDQGCLINLTVTYMAPFPSVQEELSIYGSRSCLFTRRFSPTRFSKTPPVYTQIHVDGKNNETTFTNLPEPWRPLEDFYNGIHTGHPLVSDGESNLRTIEFIENVYRSAQEKQRVFLKDHDASAS